MSQKKKLKYLQGAVSKPESSPYTMIAGAKFIEESDRALVEFSKDQDAHFRRTGRTTRLVDQIIQDLFKKPGEWIFVRDHDYGSIRYTSLDQNTKHIWGILMIRLRSEHQSLSDLLEFDRPSYRIKLIIDPKKLQAVRNKLQGK